MLLAVDYPEALSVYKLRGNILSKRDVVYISFINSLIPYHTMSLTSSGKRKTILSRGTSDSKSLALGESGTIQSRQSVECNGRTENINQGQTIHMT